MGIKLTANVLFSGIGCQERGIEDSKLFDLDVITTSDINKESILAYAAVHCGLTPELVETYTKYPPKEEMIKELTEKNIGYVPEKNKVYDWGKLAKKKGKELEKYWLAVHLTNSAGDISKIESLPYADLWTCSFPCTDISIAGKMKGLSPNAETRSSLLWENIRLLKKAKEDGKAPKYILFENVKNLVSKAFIKDFNSLLSVLEELGYNSYWKVLNAKDCGVPQNRERVFVVCIRKDIDNGKFEFPKPYDTGVRLKNILDLEVEEKYYISKAIQDRFKLTDKTFTKNTIGTTKCRDDAIGQRYLVYNPNGIIGALTATDYKQPKQFMDIDQAYIDNIDASKGFVKRKVQELKDEKGKLPELFNAYNKVEIEDYAPTLTTMCGSTTSSATVLKKDLYFRIRKLTPYECWKLMGFVSEDCKKAEDMGLAAGHLYKQAGNGIVTNCVELIMEHLYKAQYDEKYECTDEFFKQPQKV